MPFFFLFWTDEMIEHLAEYGISREEFEYVVSNPVSEDISDSSGRPAVWGYLPDGRYVIAVYDLLDKVTVLPVTAYEVPEPTR